MKCIKCNTVNSTKVISSRYDEKNNTIRRRRECINCGFRFSTDESIEKKVLYIKKKDQSIEKFNSDKVRLGIVKACEKRSITTEQIDNMLNKIESKLLNLGIDEINANTVGEFVMEELKKIDEVSYIRYAAVYKKFKDIDSFNKEIENLKNGF